MAITGGTVTAPSADQELLQSLPDLTRRKNAGDGTEPSGTAGQSASDQSEPDAPKTLLDAKPDELFKTVEQLVRSQDRLAKNRWAIDIHFDSIRCGIPFSRLEKIPNVSQWVQKFPSGFSKQSFGATPNKADDLCNKIEDTLMADPPKPDPSRHVNDESVREAAELAGKVLLEDGGEAGTNDNETYRWALNNAFSRSASFLHYRVDPSGGGYQPLQVLAHPAAQDPANPMIGLVPQPPDAMGQPTPPIPEFATNPILRYVSADNQFVEDASQADKVWLPKTVIERLRREQVRCFPYNAPAEQADAVILIRWMTLADAVKQWPKTVGPMTDTQLNALAGWRPAMAETMTIPYAFLGLSGGGSGPSPAQVGSLSPLMTKRMYSYRIYVKKCPEYPEGFWADVSGATGFPVLDSGTMDYTVTVPTQGKVTRCKQIPVVQIRPQMDVSGGDPMGWPVISRFAGGSEAQSTLYAAFADLCDNMLHPHVFIRGTTAVDEDDWADRTTPILLSPTDQEPNYEQFPSFPPVMEFLDRNNTAMDTASGLTATAQGLDSSNSVSGVAKQLSVRQAQVSMSGFQQNLHAGMTRGWNIKCELIQAEFSIPQLVGYSGEAESSEPQWWTGVDFAGIDTIGIQPGTGTMMTPEGKAQYVAFLQQQKWLDQDQASDVALPGIRADLGIPENPAVAWLERCVSAWMMGPTPEWTQAQQAQAQQIQQAQQAYQAQAQQFQQAGQQPPAFQPPQLPPLPSPFPNLPTLTEIPVAQAVVKRLGALMFDPRFADTKKYPAPWQALVTNVYSQARTAQIPPNIPKIEIRGQAKDAQTLSEEEGATPSQAKPQQPQGVAHQTAPPMPRIAA